MNRRGLLTSAALGLLLTVSSAASHAQTAGSGEWSTPMQLSTDRSEIGTVLINGKVYIAGGNALGRQDSPLFQELDLATGRSRDLAPMPKGSSHLVMATLNGKIYLAMKTCKWLIEVEQKLLTIALNRKNGSEVSSPTLQESP